MAGLESVRPLAGWWGSTGAWDSGVGGWLGAGSSSPQGAGGRAAGGKPESVPSRYL